MLKTKQMEPITRKTSADYEPDFINGETILIDKPLINTSFDIVYKIRKAVLVKKVGHTGTLDPMATGLLIVCTGKMTKEINRLMGLNKTYTGIISVGKTTPSFDTETDFDSIKSIEGATKERVMEISKSFLGTSMQTPPMYSAVKKNGKSLYKFARKGIEVERKPREIFISKFDITKIELPDIHFEICCSTGTYIRVIAHESGQMLGCGAYLKSLRRTKIGSFNVEDAFQINDFVEFTKRYSLAV